MTVQTPQTDELVEGGKFTPSDDSVVEEPLTYNMDRFGQLKKMGVDGLVDEGARIVALYSKATDHLRALAEVVVALKFRHKAPVNSDSKAKRGYLPAGSKRTIPDWGGQSPEFTRAVARIYEKAGVGNKESDIRNALKYHVQNLTKEVAPDAQLIKLGIKTEKRGAGGAAGSNGSAPSTTTTTSTTAAAVLSKGTKINPLEYANESIENINDALKLLSALQEVTKKGIADNDLRIRIIHVVENIAKTAQQISEMATAMSARHQGRSDEKKPAEKKEPLKAVQNAS